MEVFIHPTPEVASESVTRRIAAALEASGDRFTLGLSGGITPAPVYRALAGLGLNWERADLWLADERWVPHDHQRSNGLMVMETLVRHIDVRFHRPEWGDRLEPSDSAAHYETVIRALHRHHRPDMIHLGMGADGHTASLFPGTRAIDALRRWIVANPVPELGETRITSTFPLLWSARTLVIQATGGAKAEAVRDSLAGKTPAGRLVEGDAEVEWHLDESAASLIS
jgi:6-phosphogluconolactonase